LKRRLSNRREESRIVQIELLQVSNFLNKSLVKNKTEVRTVIQRVEGVTCEEIRARQDFYCRFGKVSHKFFRKIKVKLGAIYG